MNIMENKIEKVWFTEKEIFVSTTSGDTLNHPLKWFPRLLNASNNDRQQFEISPFGIHWPVLDEDLSLEGFYHYHSGKVKAV